MTKLIGLIGYPIEHSISPLFQQAALDYYGMDIRYEAWETHPEKLSSVINKLREPYVIGANVTLPYKQKMLKFMDELDYMVNTIGALNTIVNINGTLKGYNTDAKGFIRSLREQAHFDLNGTHVSVIGAGGAARAICFALLNEGIISLALTNRTLKSAEMLAQSLRYSIANTVQTTRIDTLKWLSPEFYGYLQDSQLIVNCTTIGMKYSLTEGSSPLPSDWIPKNALVCDLVYNPLETPLLQAAKKSGAKKLDGSYMLLYQGAYSFELWTGRRAPLDIMYNLIQTNLASWR